MVANEECEAIDVVTADHLHFEPVIECLEAGKHVMCEKPLSLDINEAEQMVAKAEEKGVHLAIDYNRRFAPGYAKAREWFDSGACGQIAYIDMKLSQADRFRRGRDRTISCMNFRPTLLICCAGLAVKSSRSAHRWRIHVSKRQIPRRIRAGRAWQSPPDMRRMPSPRCSPVGTAISRTQLNASKSVERMQKSSWIMFSVSQL